MTPRREKQELQMLFFADDSHEALLLVENDPSPDSACASRRAAVCCGQVHPIPRECMDELLGDLLLPLHRDHQPLMLSDATTFQVAGTVISPAHRALPLLKRGSHPPF
jgi:hypothetical protein